MKTYFIAIFNHMEGTNKIFVIVAKDSVEASKKALIKNCEKISDSYSDWVSGLGETFEEVKVGAANAELILSDPLMIEN